MEYPTEQRNIEIVRLHKLHEWTLGDIGLKFGITKERVRQICYRAERRERQAKRLHEEGVRLALSRRKS